MTKQNDSRDAQQLRYVLWAAARHYIEEQKVNALCGNSGLHANLLNRGEANGLVRACFIIGAIDRHLWFGEEI